MNRIRIDWFSKIALATAALCLCIAAPAMAVSVGTYKVEKVAENLPRSLNCVTRVQYGNVDRLVFGYQSSVYQYDEGWAGVQHLASFAGAYHAFRHIESVFSKGDAIYAAPVTGGQGAKLETLWIDQNGGVRDRHQDAFEWSHTDHDATHYGAGQTTVRTGRLMVGFGGPNDHSECPDWEAGQPMKGAVLEYGDPTSSKWDSWTNQLIIENGARPSWIGLWPHSFVEMDSDKVLVAAWGTGGRTYFPLLDSIPWDGARPPAPSPRALEVKGYWSMVKDSNGDNVSVPGWRDIWDPYTTGGKLNDVVFLFGSDYTPWWINRSAVNTLTPCEIYNPNSSGQWERVATSAGPSQAGAVHPVSNRPLVVAALGDQGMGIYEAQPSPNGGVALYRIAHIDDGGAHALMAVAYKDYVYIISGGNMYRVQGEPTGDASNVNLDTFVSAFYRFALNRLPDQDGYDRYYNGLKNRTITAYQMAQEILLSQEFLSRDVSNSEFVIIAYRVFYDRRETDDEMNRWLSELGDGLPRQELIRDLAYSTEFADTCARLGISPN